MLRQYSVRLRLHYIASRRGWETRWRFLSGTRHRNHPRREVLKGCLKARVSNVSEEEHRDVMNRAFRQACARLGMTGSIPIIEPVAIWILELARLGDFDIDRLVDAAVATFEEGGVKGSERWWHLLP
jgi:hypothetical protein